MTALSQCGAEAIKQHVWCLISAGLSGEGLMFMPLCSVKGLRSRRAHHNSFCKRACHRLAWTPAGFIHVIVELLHRPHKHSVRVCSLFKHLLQHAMMLQSPQTPSAQAVNESNSCAGLHW